MNDTAAAGGRPPSESPIARPTEVPSSRIGDRHKVAQMIWDSDPLGPAHAGSRRLPGGTCAEAITPQRRKSVRPIKSRRPGGLQGHQVLSSIVRAHAVVGRPATRSSGPPKSQKRPKLVWRFQQMCSRANNGRAKLHARVSIATEVRMRGRLSFLRCGPGGGSYGG